jgi:hypothetical protein
MHSIQTPPGARVLRVQSAGTGGDLVGARWARRRRARRARRRRGRHAEGARSGLDGGRAATAGHGRVSLLALSLLSLSHPLSSCPTREWWRAAAPQRAWRKPSTATTGAASGHDAASLQAGCDTGGFLPDRPHPLLSFPPIPPPPPPSSSTSRTGAQRQQQTSAGVARGPTRQLGAGTGHAAGRVL